MVLKIIIVLALWVLVSIPLGIIIGRILREKHNETKTRL